MQQAKETKEATGGASVEFPGGAETVVCTVPGVNTSPGHMQVFLEGLAPVEVGAATTQIKVRIRRGGLAGPVVSEEIVELVAAKKQSVGIQGVDEPGEVAGQSYVLTCEETKAGEKPKALGARLTATY